MAKPSMELFEQMKEVVQTMEVDAEKWSKGNRAAAARMRKGTSQLDKLGKEFRRLSIGECKEAELG